MNSRIKLSVFMPNYNDEAYLSFAIEAVLNQDFKDFEFIIIDDASTDRSVSIIEKYAEGDDRIQFIQHKKNQGICSVLKSKVYSAD